MFVDDGCESPDTGSFKSVEEWTDNGRCQASGHHFKHFKLTLNNSGDCALRDLHLDLDFQGYQVHESIICTLYNKESERLNQLYSVTFSAVSHTQLPVHTFLYTTAVAQLVLQDLEQSSNRKHPVCQPQSTITTARTIVILHMKAVINQMQSWQMKPLVVFLGAYSCTDWWYVNSHVETHLFSLALFALWLLT
jgi:hypothetical protein